MCVCEVVWMDDDPAPGGCRIGVSFHPWLGCGSRQISMWLSAWRSRRAVRTLRRDVRRCCDNDALAERLAIKPSSQA